MISSLCIALLAATGLSLWLAPIAGWLGRRIGGLVCRPTMGLPIAGRIIPRSGSLALIIAIIAASYGTWRLSRTIVAPYAAILIASLPIFIGGVVDDWRHELRIRDKALIQLASAALVVWQGVRAEIGGWPGWMNLLISLAWIVGVTNAFNLLDILDGLVLGIAVVVAITFGWIAAVNGELPAIILCAAIAGAAAGLWRSNRYPASIFLGDAGAQWLGFVFACLALSLRFAPTGRFVALLTPLLILAAPLFDTAFVIFLRLRHGRSPLAKSQDHCALRWILQGRTPQWAVRRMWRLSVAASLAGLLVFYTPNLVGAFVVLCLAIHLYFVARSADHLPAPHIPSTPRQGVQSLEPTHV